MLFFSGCNKIFLFITCDDENVIIVCLGMVFFVLFLLELHVASWIFVFIVFIKFREKVLIIIFSSNVFPVILLLLPFRDSSYMNVTLLDIAPSCDSNGGALFGSPIRKKSGMPWVLSQAYALPKQPSVWPILPNMEFL